jgi:hypothetical protein
MELDNIIGLLKRYTYSSKEKNSELGEQDAAAGHLRTDHAGER